MPFQLFFLVRGLFVSDTKEHAFVNYLCTLEIISHSRGMFMDTLAPVHMKVCMYVMYFTKRKSNRQKYNMVQSRHVS